MGTVRAVRALAHIDGGARPTNPGHAAFAVVIQLDGQMHVLSRYIGWRTNNVAEYFALITAVKFARFLGAQELEVFSDSKLVVEQVHGRWTCRSGELRPLNTEACVLLERHFSSAWSLTWIRRDKNAEADGYCTRAIQAGRFRNPWLRKHLKNRHDPGLIIDPLSRGESSPN